MAKKSIELSVIIPTYKRERIFHNTLINIINAIKNIDSEIIIINDDKNENISLPKEINKHKIKLFNNPNSGVASARNFGFKQSTGNIILFLDNDILVTEENIKMALATLKKKKGAVLNVNWIYQQNHLSKIKKHQFGRFLIKYDMVSLRGWMDNKGWFKSSLFEVENIASYFLLVYRETFIKIGGYNEKFPYAGFEDFEFAQRVNQTGIKNLMDTRITVYHIEYDRANLNNWLNRQERDGYSRRIASEIGYKQTQLYYSPIKSSLYTFISKNQNFLKIIIDFIPNIKIFDPLCFKLFKIWQGTRIHKGYCSKDF